MVKLNVSDDMLVDYMKAPEDEGTGYVAGLEVFHQLHCLVSAPPNQDIIQYLTLARTTSVNSPGLPWANITKRLYQQNSKDHSRYFVYIQTTASRHFGWR